MKKLLFTSIFGLALAVALGFGFMPFTEQKAYCAECDTVNLPEIQKIYNEFAAECAKLVTDGKEQPRKCFVANLYNKILPVMKVLAKDNRFGPGDRILFVGETQNGNLVAGANRSFQSGTPMPKDTLKVKINKLDGKNAALVKICIINEDGTQTRVGTLNFAEDATNGAQEVIVNGVEGKVVKIQIASSGGVLKNFKYALTTSH